MENITRGKPTKRAVLGIIFNFIWLFASGQDALPINCSVKSYKGFIDNNHSVSAQITIRKEEISSRKYYQKVYGTYWYDTLKLPNKFLGFAEEDSINFHVYNDNGKQTEQVVGKFSEDSIKGHWTINGKSLPFYLVPIVDYKQKYILCEIPFSFSEAPCRRLDTQNENKVFMACTDDKIILNKGNSKQLKIFDVQSLTFEKLIDIDCFVNKLYVWGEDIIIVSLTDMKCISIETGAVLWEEKMPFTWYYDNILKDGKICFYTMPNEENREVVCFDLASKSFNFSSKDSKYILTDKDSAYLIVDGKPMLNINISGGKENPYSRNDPMIMPADSMNVFCFWSKYQDWITITNSKMEIVWNFETSYTYQASIIKNRYLLLFGSNSKLYDLKSHELLWTIEQPLTPNYIMEDDILYFVSNEVVTAVDFSSGNILWFSEVKGGREVVSAGNMIFFVISSILEPMSTLTGIKKVGSTTK